jgi:hypothetical protein
MAISLLDNFSLDKTVMRSFSLKDEGDDRTYWQAQTPEVRLRALEYMRRVMYGEAVLARVIRVLAVYQREPG